VRIPSPHVGRELGRRRCAGSVVLLVHSLPPVSYVKKKKKKRKKNLSHRRTGRELRSTVLASPRTVSRVK
jgi:hypothetical protein